MQTSRRLTCNGPYRLRGGVPTVCTFSLTSAHEAYYSKAAARDP